MNAYTPYYAATAAAAVRSSPPKRNHHQRHTGGDTSGGNTDDVDGMGGVAEAEDEVDMSSLLRGETQGVVGRVGGGVSEGESGAGAGVGRVGGDDGGIGEGINSVGGLTLQGTSNSYTAINYRVTTPNQVTSDLATVLQFAVKSSTLSNNLALALKLPASRLSVLSVTVIDYSPTAAPVLTPPPTAEQSATPTPEPSTIHPTLRWLDYPYHITPHHITPHHITSHHTTA